MMKIYENISLRERNTFGFDIKCARLVEFAEAADLREVFSDPPLRWSVLGGGSNVVFTGDYQGVLLSPVCRNIQTVSDDGNCVRLRADAGVEWDEFVNFCVKNGLWGAENLSYIPGKVGAAPVQNIGAYGAEAKDIIESVEMFCVESGAMLTLAAEHCGFGYRDSVFKRSLKGKVVITSVNFLLRRTPSPAIGYGDLNEMITGLGGPTLENIREAVIRIRRSKLPEPEELGNAGSFFKNPVVPELQARKLKDIYPDMPLYPSQEQGYAKLAAGWLIDRCGLKGYRKGSVGVHEKQALVLVNYGGGTGLEIMDLAAEIQSVVSEKFGVDIETEVNVL